MDPQTSEISYSKSQAAGIEPLKKKKYARKKEGLKPTKLMQEFPETSYPELNSEINSDLIHYTYKLEYELAATKKKLKHQRKKFRNMIHSLAKYFDAKGITSQMIDDYVKLIGAQGSDDSESESDYQKLFATHKYQIIEDNTSFPTTLSNPVPVVKQPITKTVSISETISNGTPSTSLVAETPLMPPPQPEKKRGRPSQKDKEKATEKKEAKKDIDDDTDGKKKQRKSKKKDDEPVTSTPASLAKPNSQPSPVTATTNYLSSSLSMPKLDQLGLGSLISPAKDMGIDKVKKVEDLISNYEDYASRSTDPLMQSLGKTMNNLSNVGRPGVNPYNMPGYGDYNKILQELLKMNNGNPMMGDKLQPQNPNFYPNNNFK